MNIFKRNFKFFHFLISHFFPISNSNFYSTPAHSNSNEIFIFTFSNPIYHVIFPQLLQPLKMAFSSFLLLSVVCGWVKGERKNHIINGNWTSFFLFRADTLDTFELCESNGMRREKSEVKLKNCVKSVSWIKYLIDDVKNVTVECRVCCKRSVQTLKCLYTEDESENCWKKCFSSTQQRGKVLLTHSHELQTFETFQ